MQITTPTLLIFLSHLLLVKEGCAVGLLGILCITRLDFYFGRVAVVALCMVMAGVHNALYTWQVLVFFSTLPSIKAFLLLCCS